MVDLRIYIIIKQIRFEITLKLLFIDGFWSANRMTPMSWKTKRRKKKENTINARFNNVVDGIELVLKTPAQLIKWAKIKKIIRAAEKIIERRA